LTESVHIQVGEPGQFSKYAEDDQLRMGLADEGKYIQPTLNTDGSTYFRCISMAVKGLENLHHTVRQEVSELQTMYAYLFGILLYEFDKCPVVITQSEETCVEKGKEHAADLLHERVEVSDVLFDMFVSAVYIGNV
jgi:benzoyl-CoA reductase/2-hydroxyglutaryl-CoA dehydratase subunit BcrC/BadD/HgdB